MSLANLLKDPPPTHAFEVSEHGIAFAPIADPEQAKFAQFDAGAVVVSPAHDNVQQPHTVLAGIHALVPPTGQRKRRAALILPDYCARVAVLDFDAFPSQPDEQLALLRFRMKKSVPFDIDTAIVSYGIQARGQNSGEKSGETANVEILAAVIASDIVGQYEAPFRAAGFHPGFVTTSSLAALNLIAAEGLNMFVKMSGRILSVLVLNGTAIKLTRCVEMDTGSVDEIDSILHPTVAYIEDEFKTRPRVVWVAGFGADTPELVSRWQAEWGVAVQALQSRFGVPDPTNAGLFGYLESVV